MSPCSDCAQAKENQNHAPKESDHVKSEVNGTRFFTAISTIKGGKKGPSVAKKNWCILVEESTQTEFSSFYYKKINMVEPTCEQINCWKDSGMPVNYIICDNAGDNLTLEERCNSADWQMNIQFKYTPRSTPQENHLVELILALLPNKGRELMIESNVPIELRYKVFCESINTATITYLLTAITIDEKTATRFKHLFGANSAFVRFLRTWGEAGTVKTKTATTPKLENRGVKCMLVRYANNNDGN